jgi:hypothetical protein
MLQARLLMNRNIDSIIKILTNSDISSSIAINIIFKEIGKGKYIEKGSN